MKDVHQSYDIHTKINKTQVIIKRTNDKHIQELNVEGTNKEKGKLHNKNVNKTVIIVEKPPMVGKSKLRPKNINKNGMNSTELISNKEIRIKIKKMYVKTEERNRQITEKAEKGKKTSAMLYAFVT